MNGVNTSSYELTKRITKTFICDEMSSEHLKSTARDARGGDVAKRHAQAKLMLGDAGESACLRLRRDKVTDNLVEEVPVVRQEVNMIINMNDAGTAQFDPSIQGRVQDNFVHRYYGSPRHVSGSLQLSSELKMMGWHRNNVRLSLLYVTAAQARIVRYPQLDLAHKFWMRVQAYFTQHRPHYHVMNKGFDDDRYKEFLHMCVNVCVADCAERSNACGSDELNDRLLFMDAQASVTADHACLSMSLMEHAIFWPVFEWLALYVSSTDKVQRTGRGYVMLGAHASPLAAVPERAEHAIMRKLSADVVQWFQDHPLEQARIGYVVEGNRKIDQFVSDCMQRMQEVHWISFDVFTADFHPADRFAASDRYAMLIREEFVNTHKGSTAFFRGALAACAPAGCHCVTACPSSSAQPHLPMTLTGTDASWTLDAGARPRCRLAGRFRACALAVWFCALLRRGEPVE